MMNKIKYNKRIKTTKIGIFTRVLFRRNIVKFLAPAVFMIATVSIVTVYKVRQFNLLYNFSLSSKVVTNKHRKLADAIKYDGGEGAFIFNRNESAEKDDGKFDPSIAQKLGGGENSNQLYGAKLGRDLNSQNVEIYNNELKIGFNMKPKFESLKGRKIEEGHIVYPLKAEKGQLVYTVEDNGIKEDIVLNEYVGERAEFAFELNLGEYLEARILPDGSIGVYSADPMLFGDISYASNNDKELLNNTRRKAEKNYLTFTIPKPVVYQSRENGQNANRASSEVNAFYQLRGNELTVHAEGLGGLNYPISIDPSIVLNLESEFSAINADTNNLDYSDNNLNRNKLSAGYLKDGVDAGSEMTTARSEHCMVIYGDYMYVIGGQGSGDNNLSSIEYAKVESDGTIPGSWTTDSIALPDDRIGHTCQTYNDYIYVIGGASGDSGASYVSTVYYAKLKPSGGIASSFQSASSLTYGRFGIKSAVYNGYLYALGGNQGAPEVRYVEYAKIKPDGSLESWQYDSGANNLIADLTEGGSVAYDGYIYYVGGMDWYKSCGGFCDVYDASGETYVAKIGSNGDIGSWYTSTPLNVPRMKVDLTVVNDNLYILGGTKGSNDSPTQEHQANYEYAPINKDGSIGKWNKVNISQNLQKPRINSYNGRVFATGDWISGEDTAFYYDAVDHEQFDPIASVNNLGARRRNHSSIVHNGNLYVIGGRDNGGTILSSLAYTSINSDGTLGTWANTSNSLGTAVENASAVVYGNKLYVIGGENSSGTEQAIVQTTTLNFGGNTAGAFSNVTNGNLDTARSKHTAEIYNKYIYVVGGDSGSGRLDTIEYIALESDGDIDTSAGAGCWDSTETFSTARYNHATVVYNGFLYVLGGNTSGGQTNDVRYAPINSDGSIGTWSTSTVLPSSVEGLTANAYNGSIFITGGYDGTDQQTAVRYIALRRDGSLSSSWTTSSVSLLNDVQDHTVNVYAGHMIVTGGYDSDQGTPVLLNADSASLYVKPIGELYNWVDDNNATSYTGRRDHCSIASQGYLYVIGGRNGSGLVTSIQYTALSGGGVFGNWSTDSATLSREMQACVVRNDRLYVIGGKDGSGETTDTRHIGLSSSGGTSGSWDDSSSGGNDPLDTALHSMAVTVYNDYIYVLGGDDDATSDGDGVGNDDPVNTVYYSSFTGGNDINSWSTTTAMNIKRSEFDVVAFDGYMYIAGGITGANADLSRTQQVEYVDINGNGTLGSSWRITSSLPIEMAEITMEVVNGWVYIMGGEYGLDGDSAGTRTEKSYHAPIIADGGLDIWRTQPSQSYTTARSGHDAVIFNNFVYLTGGYDGSTYRDDEYFAKVVTGSRVSEISYQYQFMDGTLIDNVVVNGSAPTEEVINLEYVTQCTGSSSYGSRTSQADITMGSTYNINTSGRYVFIFVRTDYSAGPTFPLDGTVISDLTINYRIPPPNPDVYMRHGSYFIEGWNHQEVEQPEDSNTEGTPNDSC